MVNLLDSKTFLSPGLNHSTGTYAIVVLRLDVLCDAGESVELVEYEGSAAGLIRSFTERFSDDAEEVEAHLLELNKRDASCWC